MVWLFYNPNKWHLNTIHLNCYILPIKFIDQGGCSFSILGTGKVCNNFVAVAAYGYTLCELIADVQNKVSSILLAQDRYFCELWKHDHSAILKENPNKISNMMKV